MPNAHFMLKRKKGEPGREPGFSFLRAHVPQYFGKYVSTKRFGARVGYDILGEKEEGVRPWSIAIRSVFLIRK